MISSSSSRGVPRLLLLVCVHKSPELHCVAMYHDIPCYTTYFLWLYQVPIRYDLLGKDGLNLIVFVSFCHSDGT